MILLFTDFGAEGPYLGQVEAVLRRQAPGTDVINLLSNAPAEPALAAYLLAALAPTQAEGAVFLCVIDPEVGGKREAVVLEADGRWFIGPNNGLLNNVAKQADQAQWRIIDWRPDPLSASFHGRDLFAPITARVAHGDFTWDSHTWAGPNLQDWPADLAVIAHVDHYGNAITGTRYSPDMDGKILHINGHPLAQARTFCDSPAGAAFWYRDSLNLVEIAVNRGRADTLLGLTPGMAFTFEEPTPRPPV